MSFDISKEECRAFRLVMRKHWARFLRSFVLPTINTSPETNYDPAFNRRDNPGHAWVNLFVEARRASPYITGHVDAVAYPALIAAVLLAAWL
jgi:hypothetical protein